jgi:hypothetical protein
MKVLIACEFSGIVREAFKARGHDAVSCDLLPTEIPGEHVQADALDMAYRWKWDLMIAHPPCTYLCRASARWWKGRESEQNAAVEFVRKLLAAPIPMICIENPPGALTKMIRPPDQYIQPYWFGEDASKMTGLWLKGLPKLRHTNFVDGVMYCCGRKVQNDDKYGCPVCEGDNVAKRRYGNQTPSGQNAILPGPDRWKDRSRTYPGIAAAMADQWGCA